MGNREDLLIAAKRCLYEKGYARTTARDVATAAGVSLAAIGYHYGSKEALLNQAFQLAAEEWGDELARMLSAATEETTDPTQRFAATWNTVLESFSASRQLWALQFELLAHVDSMPHIRETFAESIRQARLGLVELFGPGGNDRDPQSVGAFYQALLIGLAAVWVTDADSAPSGRELLDGMLAVTAAMHDDGAPPPPPADADQA